jgi:hypothetical protein
MGNLTSVHLSAPFLLLAAGWALSKRRKYGGCENASNPALVLHTEDNMIYITQGPEREKIDSRPMPRLGNRLHGDVSTHARHKHFAEPSSNRVVAAYHMSSATGKMMGSLKAKLQQGR